MTKEPNQSKNESDSDILIDESNVDDIIADMIESTPSSQPHIEEDSNNENKNSVKNSTNNIKNPLKSKFDPQIHAVNDDGSPVLTKTGKFRKKPKEYKTNAKTAKLNDPFNEEKPSLNLIEVNSRAAAQVVQDLKRSAYNNFLGCMYGDDRHYIYIDATTNYFVSSGGVTLTPLHTILLLEGALFLEAMGKPKALDKLSKLKIWIAEKYLKFKRRKYGTQSSSRPNHERENDTSDVDGKGYTV